MRLRYPLCASVLTVLIDPALAHPGHVSDSVLEGLSHPVLGLDHVLAMVVGFTLAASETALPMVEPGIAVSVFVLGMLVAAAVRLPPAALLLLVSFFAVLHGYPHGGEIHGGGFAFGLGLVATTAVLLGVGVGLGRALSEDRLVLARGVGGVVAGIGLVLIGSLA